MSSNETRKDAMIMSGFHLLHSRLQHMHRIRLLGVVAGLALMLSACSIPVGSTAGTTSVATVTASAPPACPSQAYCAKIPGPQCDPGGARWLAPEPASVTCATTGMQLSAASSKVAGVGFVPPSNTFPLSFSVAVTVHVDTSLDGCVSVSTIGHAGSYTYFVCPIGLWFINLSPQGAPSQELAKGTLAASADYHIVVTTSGTSRTLTVNSTPAGSVTDGTVPATIAVGLSLANQGSTPQSATFSDFVYTPLA